VIKIGLPGASNALAISRRLGLKESILNEALSNLSEDAQKFENIVRTAEESRIKADETLRECSILKAEWQKKIQILDEEKEKLQKEKDKLYASAKAESRRIINQRAADAEELLESIEEIFAKQQLAEADLIKARTLKNKIIDKAYESEHEESFATEYVPIQAKDVKVGMKVYVQTTAQEGIVQNIRLQKDEVEVLCGNIRIRSKISDLAQVIQGGKAQTATNSKKQKWQKKGPQEKVQVSKSLVPKRAPSLELNVIGMTVQEALPDVEAFIDAAVISNLEEIRIVHGVGTGKLRAGIHDFLRKHRNVAEYRLGVYGEGETGVTIVKIK
jgi:DNA mismatch repair protein MutS2